MSEALTTESPPRKMTYEEFLAWADEDTRAEWVNGEVVWLSPISHQHQMLLKLLIYIVDGYVTQKKLGTVSFAPFQMKLPLSGREPDLMFVASARADRIKSAYLEGPADLAVEIVSPESEFRDRSEKYGEYEQAGVREFWLLDPQRKQAEFFTLGIDGIYRPLPVGEDGLFRSVVVEGLWLKVGWFWQEPLPSHFDIYREWSLPL